MMKTATEGPIALPNLLLVISGPSGVGKGTLVRRYLEERPETHLSISATTRTPRPGEVAGVHYHFLEIPGFQALREEGQLLEWAEVFRDLYGTPRRPVETALTDGLDVILEIDVQGGLKVRQAMPQAVLVFVLPPSYDELTRRLICRHTERQDQVEFRLQTARLELQ
jgi:guanylate kinase